MFQRRIQHFEFKTKVELKKFIKAQTNINILIYQCIQQNLIFQKITEECCLTSHNQHQCFKSKTPLSLPTKNPNQTTDMENGEGERERDIYIYILHLGEGERGMDTVTQLGTLAGEDLGLVQCFDHALFFNHLVSFSGLVQCFDHRLWCHGASSLGMKREVKMRRG